MASVNVAYHCGCKFSTKKLEEATKHADEKKHTLTAHGEIRPK